MFVELDIAAFRPPQFCELLLEGLNTRLVLGVALSIRHEDSNAPNTICRLGTRCQGPSSDCAAEKRDEVASLHLLTQGEDQTLPRYVKSWVVRHSKIAEPMSALGQKSRHRAYLNECPLY